MKLGRRMLAGAVAVLLLPPVTLHAATTDLVVHCDTTLGPTLAAIAAAYAARSGVRLRVFPTAPGLIVPQLRRKVQNDIVITGLDGLDAAGSLVRAPSISRWRNRLVVATGRAPGAFAVPDLPMARGIDGMALLARAGILPGSVLGVPDTEAVASLIDSGAAGAGLVMATDIRSHAGLTIAQPIDDDLYPAILYGAAVTTLTRRGDPQAFLDFLATSPAAALLAQGGLEVLA